jgi:long-chain acyl-CoA synthetase
MDNLFTQFEDATARHGGRLAVAFRPRYRTTRWDYTELAAQARALAGELARHGVGPGDRVLLYAGSSPFWVAAYFAVLGRGAAVVPLNPQSSAAQLERVAAAAEPRAALVSAHAPWRAAVPCIVIERAGPAAPPCDDFPGRGCGADDLAAIVFTSGTTGDPKGVMLTHGNLMANIAMVGRAAPLAPADHVLTIVPLFHMYAQMTSMLYPLRCGAAVTYLTAPGSRLILEALRFAPVTHLVAVPEFLKTVMARVDARFARVPRVLRRLLAPAIRARISSTLHTIVSGGAALDPDVERWWRALGYTVLQGYGLTETSPVVASNTADAWRTGSVGKPCAGLDVRIAADGEILVRGPSVMAGYFRDAARTGAAFDDGWFRTGDGGHMDDDGFLYVHGRRKYMILGPSGENVFPEDIEAELAAVPGVRDSAVFGLERGGRTVVHAVLLCDDCDGDRVIAQANRQLAPHQQIMSWSRWPQPDFPRSATRKPKKEEIMAAVAVPGTTAPATAGPATALTQLVARVTGHDAAGIHPGTRLVGDLGVDSLLRIELVSCVEEELNVLMDENLITPQTTMAELEAHIAARGGRAPRVTPYPRWSLAPWARAVRPALRALLLEWWMRPLCRLEVGGLEHLAGLAGPVIFMPNHRSFLDTVAVVMAMPPPLRDRIAVAAATIVLYGRYRGVAPLADLTYNSYPFPSEAWENIRPGLDYTGRLVDDGWNVLVYPEGQMRRNEPVRLQPLKAGAGMLAVEMQVPVVPVAVSGTDVMLPPDCIVPRRRGRVRVLFGAPLHAAPDMSFTAAAARIGAALDRLLAQLEPRRGP